MSIMLGNLTVTEIEKRTGLDFPEDVKQFMLDTHQVEASKIGKGKWHCFDIPFTIVCGDVETATKIYNSVKGRAGDCKEPLEFCIAR